MAEVQLSTGLPGLDRMLKGLIAGDNVVWQYAAVEDYGEFVRPFCEFARARGKKLVYFRFADHAPLVPAECGAEVIELRVEAGFEQFIAVVHRAIGAAGRGAYLVFDSLSTLAVDWYSDRMLGNFFLLTCPYILDQESIAYFGLGRGLHSVHATTPIGDTAQIVLDVYRHEGKSYVHPIKVQHRYSPSMYTLHHWSGDEFVPVTDSATSTEILSAVPWAGMESVRLRLGVWNRAFLQAAELWEAVQRGQEPREAAEGVLPTLLRMVVSRDERVLRLVQEYLTLGDVLDIWKRMIGTGLIGGKSVGMLLARAILRKAEGRWRELLEVHDSFYIGSDVFYTFLVQSGCWWLRQKQLRVETFLEGVEEARRRIILGTFPASVQKDFTDMLAYFGQSPIIVRSSSLLEDNFGNAFAGKYESVFCANQGPHQKRLEDFMSAVRTIYASTMSERALRYRAQRHLLDRDEQMSLLVQRVSGSRQGSLFYPQIAGVGLSYNPFVWSPAIDPQAGMLRLVFGLGTRAVNRADDDYTRVVALNDPERRPEADWEEVRQYSQRYVDAIDLEANQLVACEFGEVVRRGPELPLDIFATEDRGSGEDLPAPGAPVPHVLTFGPLLKETSFPGEMRDMLRTLQEAYGCPVDVEFTANFLRGGGHKINLVQCRPLQVSGDGVATALPEHIPAEDLVLEARGAVIGHSRLDPIERIVYVVPANYARLSGQDRYGVARVIGEVLRAPETSPPRQVMLVGPGRWGTTTPSLGVPISFAEISRVSYLCEIVALCGEVVPDVSLGTHFFNDLVEMDMLYLALFPARKGNVWNRPLLEETWPNRLTEVLPGAARWAEVIRVLDFPAREGKGALRLNANAVAQRVVCYLDRETRSP
jgi:pyruvate, water dikinase